MVTLVVKCLGGLGNQMTQYAFYKELEFRGYNVKFYIGDFDSVYKLRAYQLEKIFGLKINYANISEIESYYTFTKKVLRKLKITNSGLIVQNHFEFYEPYLIHDNDALLIGYWQSEKYFTHVKELLRKEFIFPELGIEYNGLVHRIKNSNSVSIHIRRGDYVGNPIYDGVCNEDYYKKAIDYIKSNVQHPTFFIFSNDIEWCKSNVIIDNSYFVENTFEDSNFCDMQLMSMCKNNIIANSSFSWWSAWLNATLDKIVIAPKRFFGVDNYHNEVDIYPESWIKL